MTKKAVRSALLIFVAGWGLWFWLDKTGPLYTMARDLPAGDSLVRDSQVFFDLLKSGEPGPAYTYFWSAHPFVSTLAVAAAVWLGAPLFRYAVGALRHRRRRIAPAHHQPRTASAPEASEEPSAGEDYSRN
ncbi:MAG: hypothetical protein LJE91_12980 [Gammaproteobacteria bacterium]|jgi:hypothetical protein|nr:hypothetical protein [Gammaproteobacteria bacterium]